MTTFTPCDADDLALLGLSSDFGRELRRRRRDAGLTLRSLATHVAFGYSYLDQVERGARTGSVKLAQRCDQALGADGQLVALFVSRRQ